MTHDKAFRLDNLEKAGQEVNADFSLGWFHNFPVVDSNLPYQVDWRNTNRGYWQKFLLGTLDISDDAVWDAYKAEVAKYNGAELIACYDAAYARYLEGQVA